MIETGLVKEIKNKKALISLQSSQACHQCGKCLLAQNGEMQLWALDEVGAKAGDKVQVEISSKASVFASLMVFIFPVTAVLIGYFMGAYIAGLIKSESVELWGIVSSILLLILSGVVLYIVDKFIKSLSINPCRILSIL